MSFASLVPLVRARDFNPERVYAPGYEAISILPSHVQVFQLREEASPTRAFGMTVQFQTSLLA